MSSAYQHLALADVRPGMVLSDVLLDNHGQVLLPQGTVLTAEVIALMPRHGVDALPVLREGAIAAEPAPDQAALRARLAHLFRLTSGDGEPIDDSANRTLQRYMEDYRVGREAGQ